MKNTNISQIVEVSFSIRPAPTYSSLVDHLRAFCYKNKVSTKLTVEIDEYGDACPCVQVAQGNESLYAEVAILMTAWKKGELENE